jgi:hypothetical protein
VQWTVESRTQSVPRGGSTFELNGMSRTMLRNAALMVRLSNFYSSFKQSFSRIFCSSFKLFENQTFRLSRVQCILVFWVAILRSPGSCLSTFWRWIIS